VKKTPYQTFLKSIYGMIFFGVPNRGLEIEQLAHMVKGQPNERLVFDLAPRSQFLEMLHENFCERFTFDDIEVISFYETEETKTVMVTISFLFLLPFSFAFHQPLCFKISVLIWP
jgi:hypothetical protein